MKRDISGETDVELLVNAFYTKVRADEYLGPVFNSIVGDHWDAHLPKMYSFWNMVFFGKAGYTGNAVQKHIGIHQQMPLRAEQFDRWIALWHETLDDLFEGPQVAEGKKRAGLMLQLIQIKISGWQDGKSLI